MHLFILINITVVDSVNMYAQDIIIDTPKKVIIDCDMCVGADDVGALAMLHAMADQEEVEILAVCYNEVHPKGVIAIDAINTWYNRSEIPIGNYKDSLEGPNESEYLGYLEKFPHNINNEMASSALDVYLKVLNEQDDNTVIIVSIGFLNNIYDLLRTDPNLVSSKVSELVIMGAVIDDGFNLSYHNLVKKSEYVIENWPTSIVFSQSGTDIISGTNMSNAPPENPVREAYQRIHSPYFNVNSSWDQVAVLYAVRGSDDYFNVIETGNGRLVNGYEWSMKPGFRSHIDIKVPASDLSSLIDSLMMKPPRQ